VLSTGKIASLPKQAQQRPRDCFAKLVARTVRMPFDVDCCLCEWLQESLAGNSPLDCANRQPIGSDAVQAGIEYSLHEKFPLHSWQTIQITACNMDSMLISKAAVP
jgi:hypothetical protein